MVKIDIPTKTQVKNIVNDTTSDRFHYIYTELTKLRNQILKLGEEVQILKNN